MIPTLRLAQKVNRPAMKAALKSSAPPKTAPVNQPLKPAKPLSETITETLTGEPTMRTRIPDREAAAAKGKNKTIVDSFRCECRWLYGALISSVRRSRVCSYLLFLRCHEGRRGFKGFLKSALPLSDIGEATSGTSARTSHLLPPSSCSLTPCVPGSLLSLALSQPRLHSALYQSV